jgi:hypothetical protein
MGAVRSTAKMAKMAKIAKIAGTGQVRAFDMGAFEDVHEHLKV